MPRARARKEPKALQKQITETLGKTLRALRTKNNLTLAAVAERIGTSLQSVQAWETARAIPNEDHLARLAALYKTTPADLRYGAKSEVVPPEEFVNAEFGVARKKLEELLATLFTEFQKKHQVTLAEVVLLQNETGDLRVALRID